MIYVVLGTRAQLIKMAPVLRVLEERRAQVRLLLTGQHHETMDDLIADFGIRTRPELVYRGPEASGLPAMARWGIGCLWQFLRHRRRWFEQPDRARDVIVVHGDTFSTLLGALVGRLLRVRVAHVESGLRSFNLRHPFPEELTRLAVFRLADIAFCPGSWAAGNLADQKHLEVIDTQHNTLLDAVRYALRTADAASGPAYVVVSVHRFENLHSRQRLEAIVQAVTQLAARLRVVMVLHPVTERVLRRRKLLQVLGAAGVELTPRMAYTRFLALVAGAKAVLTDGGSNQEELSYLGVRAVLLREATERREGLGANVVLAGYDVARVVTLVAEARPSPGARLPDISPSAIVADQLAWAA
jgi:UDP-N-acetylglucosamine 2-epimerase (non-hydrolysing)